MHFLIAVIVHILLFSSLSYAAPTVFLKDGTNEVGSSVWTENDKVYLNKSKEIYEYSFDEVRLDETLKYNKLGSYQVVTPEERISEPGVGISNQRQTKQVGNAARMEKSVGKVDEPGSPVVTARSTSQGSNPDARDTSPEAVRFIKQFREAMNAGNLAALSGMVNWRGVNAETRRSVEFALKECMRQKIQEVYIGRVPAGMPLEYKLNGKTYRPNLAPGGYLNIVFVPGPKTGQVTITSTGFMVGRSGSRIMIASAAEF